MKVNIDFLKLGVLIDCVGYKIIYSFTLFLYRGVQAEGGKNILEAVVVSVEYAYEMCVDKLHEERYPGGLASSSGPSINLSQHPHPNESYT